jgi:hypothetical protein
MLVSLGGGKGTAAEREERRGEQAGVGERAEVSRVRSE